eukprot:UN10009
MTLRISFVYYNTCKLPFNPHVPRYPTISALAYRDVTTS